MTINYFRTWLMQEKNQYFWKETPLPSEQMDGLLKDRNILKSIASSRSNQYLYGFIENRIVNGYADLINYQLRKAYAALPLTDFRDPSGFECKEKSSVAQKEYYRCFHELEYFLKQDILQHHKEPNAQLNSFRRWIEISDALLKRHCYDGFLLTIANLQLLAKPYWITELPSGLQNTYEQMCKLSLSDKNHVALRTFMEKNRHESDFSPVLLNSHSIAWLNNSMTQLQEIKLNLLVKANELQFKIDELGRNKNLKYSKSIQLNRAALLKEKKENKDALVKNANLYKDQLKQCYIIMNKVDKEQHYPLKPLPDFLKKSIEVIQLRYQTSLKQEIKKKDNVRDDRKIIGLSKLYRHHLLPSFWKRAGKSPDKHWNDTFSISLFSNNIN